MRDFDRRLTPARPDLAAEHLKGEVFAERFVTGAVRRVVASAVPLRPAPDHERSIDTELLFGEGFVVYDSAEGWAWGQAVTDDYVGYVAAGALSADDRGPVPTHRVAALRTYRYPEAELKRPPLGLLSMGALVSVIDRTTVRGLDYALLADGSAVVARHLVPLEHREPDWVAVAESFLGTPYLWGGRTSLGLDCSALVQIPAAAGGLKAPRDSDMQENGFGAPLDIAAGLPDLRRGDLVFWKGHVGIMLDADRLLHANGYSMTVAIEPLATASARMAEAGLPVTTVRRP